MGRGPPTVASMTNFCCLMSPGRLGSPHSDSAGLLAATKHSQDDNGACASGRGERYALSASGPGGSGCSCSRGLRCLSQLRTSGLLCPCHDAGRPQQPRLTDQVPSMCQALLGASSPSFLTQSTHQPEARECCCASLQIRELRPREAPGSG